MNQNFDIALDECLTHLQAGQPLEECLAGYPEYAGELRPLLQTALRLQEVPHPAARPEAIQAGLAQAIAAQSAQAPKISSQTFHSSQPVSFGTLSRYTGQIVTQIQRFLMGEEPNNMKRALRIASIFLAIFIIAGTMTVTASANSLPGDPFYSVKRSWEQVRMSLTLNPETKQTLEQSFDEQRIQEVQSLLDIGRQATIEVEGVLEAVGDGEFTVSGLTFTLAPDADVEGVLEVGQRVKVEGMIQEGGLLLALEVEVLESSDLPDMVTPPNPSMDDDQNEEMEESDQDSDEDMDEDEIEEEDDDMEDEAIDSEEVDDEDTGSGAAYQEDDSGDESSESEVEEQEDTSDDSSGDEGYSDDGSSQENNESESSGEEYDD